MLLFQDQDSWSGTTGAADHHPSLNIFTSSPVPSRRSRLSCRGSFACSELDLALVDVTRYELDPAPRSEIVAAEVRTQNSEGQSSEQLAAA